MNNRFYYHLKPYVPWPLRMAMRQMLARRTWKSCKDVWPINEVAGQEPAGWKGWPEGKRFAFVLTHDVEGPRGLAKCRQLMQLEQKFGFRSSFNFIPEGDYMVPRELREELTRNGFEVGVHDLHHDGKLYWTRRDFSENARQINRYVKEWGASGFRSGFMHHNLDWAHDLEIKYDASTFDTDPFEPQPDGVNTIFPFWVPAPPASRPTPHPKGYIELPYTLPQDSTMFFVLRQTTIDIWKKKLDWVADRGGMALLGVHPDYVAFEGSAGTLQDYPCRLYRELLNYVREKYQGQYWQALPQEVAEFCSVSRPIRPKVNQRRVCMITHSFYQTDNRVIRYAEALAARGDLVDVIALKRKPDSPDEEKIGRVNLTAIAGRTKKNQTTKAGYLLPILRFWFAASAKVTRKNLLHRYDLVHVHNVPDFLVFAAWWPKLFGAKIILDIHDIVPEFYASKFQFDENRFDVKMLKGIERASAGFASHVIISNHLWHKTYVSRSARAEKCSVFINYVDSDVFRRQERTRNDGKFIVLFPGGLQWHQGLDIAISAFTKVVKEFPQAEFHIYGDGDMKGKLIAQVESLGLAGKVKFFDPLPLREIVQVMANADLGVVPKRANSFGNEAYSTKIMEFMAVGVPVLISRTKIDQYYFKDDVVRFFESGNEDDLATEMLDLIRDDVQRQQLVQNSKAYVDLNNWNTRRNDYLDLVDSLISRNGNGTH